MRSQIIGFFIIKQVKNNARSSKKHSTRSTGGPDVEYDYNNILAVYKTMYENA